MMDVPESQVIRDIIVFMVMIGIGWGALFDWTDRKKRAFIDDRETGAATSVRSGCTYTIVTFASIALMIVMMLGFLFYVAEISPNIP